MLETDFHAYVSCFNQFETPICIKLPSTLMTLSLILLANDFAAVAQVFDGLHVGRAV